jgi:hypothetical protein
MGPEQGLAFCGRAWQNLTEKEKDGKPAAQRNWTLRPKVFFILWLEG